MGIWFRTKRPTPGKEAYKPGLVRGDAPVEDVPERLRGLRLERRRTARMTRTPVLVHVAIVLAVIGFLAGLVLVFTPPR